MSDRIFYSPQITYFEPEFEYFNKLNAVIDTTYLSLSFVDLEKLVRLSYSKIIQLLGRSFVLGKCLLEKDAIDETGSRAEFLHIINFLIINCARNLKRSSVDDVLIKFRTFRKVTSQKFRKICKFVSYCRRIFVEIYSTNDLVPLSEILRNFVSQAMRIFNDFIFIIHTYCDPLINCEIQQLPQITDDFQLIDLARSADFNKRFITRKNVVSTCDAIIKPGQAVKSNLNTCQLGLFFGSNNLFSNPISGVQRRTKCNNSANQGLIPIEPKFGTGDCAFFNRPRAEIGRMFGGNSTEMSATQKEQHQKNKSYCTQAHPHMFHLLQPRLSYEMICFNIPNYEFSSFQTHPVGGNILYNTCHTVKSRNYRYTWPKPATIIIEVGGHTPQHNSTKFDSGRHNASANRLVLLIAGNDVGDSRVAVAWLAIKMGRDLIRQDWIHEYLFRALGHFEAPTTLEAATYYGVQPRLCLKFASWREKRLRMPRHLSRVTSSRLSAHQSPCSSTTARSYFFKTHQANEIIANPAQIHHHVPACSCDAKPRYACMPSGEGEVSSIFACRTTHQPHANRIIEAANGKRQIILIGPSSASIKLVEIGIRAFVNSTYLTSARALNLTAIGRNCHSTQTPARFS